ncbi:hypothetical protein NIIDMKKI_37420 [Mycobacterium kansasii]|uniref:Phage integrase family protein n=1 Tax=Mycobacterium kansasii TaxID=1768 RepID=A0A7G1IBU2_MYCKA|nr:hypothetical protein NIIDMKKI_37420 [Mycobacterium kansasii]
MVGNALTTTRWPTPNTGNDTPGFTQLQPVLPHSRNPTTPGNLPRADMADAGVPVHVFRKIAGHADLSTTQRYLHPDRQSVAGAGELPSKHLWSQNGTKLRVV